jgi:uncharacterized membrane protein SirB2
MMQESSLFNAKLVKVLPHIIDTILLVSALTLVGLMGAFPTFVLVKVAALFVYIALGMMAFRFMKGWGSRVFMFFMALAVYAFIVSVAVTKKPTRVFVRYSVSANADEGDAGCLRWASVVGE